MTEQISIVSPRLDAKPWGGRRLESLGVALPPEERIGEALLTANEARVTAGAFTGMTLGEIVAADPARMLGDRGAAAVGGRATFPLLAKLIDASENLSIQVHPNDEQAVSLDRLGKTEAWHVLGVDAGANLYVGVRPYVGMERFTAAATRLDGSTAELMRTISPEVSSTILIPAGTIHALGAGTMVYEIQQPSDVTFRLDDWGRVDATGKPRETHLEQGLAVSRLEFTPEFIAPVRVKSLEGERHLLAACRYFALERIALSAGGIVDVGEEGTPTVVTVVAGTANIDGHALVVGQSAIVWPGGQATLRATTPLTALLASVPELEVVVDRARLSGAEDAEICALAGATKDIRPGGFE